jgi:uncharacterized protein GlcG (DUF336 family)
VRHLAGKARCFLHRGLIRIALASVVVATLTLIGAWYVSPIVRSQGAAQLTPAEVAGIMRAAAEAIDDPGISVAVVDRRARILGVYSRRGAAPTGPDIAVTLGRTAALFSNAQAPLVSRTIRFISGRHFPPGVDNTPAGPLYGVENINRGCQLTENENEPYERPRSIAGSGVRGGVSIPCRPNDTRGCAIGSPITTRNGVFQQLGITTGKTDVFDRSTPFDNPVNPGGFAIYRAGQVIGAVGVSGAPPDRAEYAAFVAAATQPGLSALPFDPLPEPGAVFIEGFRLPFFSDCLDPDCVRERIGQGPPGGGGGTFLAADVLVPARGGLQVDEGYLIGPTASNQPGGLTFAEVTRIVDQAVARANVTRAQVRLPIGQTAKVIIAVTDQGGRILALFRMPDALADAVDVVPSKARNAYYFSTREGYDVLRDHVLRSPEVYEWEPLPPGGQGWAVTSRTLGFGGQPLFPPGIDAPPEADGKVEKPGPWFELFLYDTENPCTEGPGPSRGGNRNFLFQNGITWFPGSAPLYRNGALIGGIGVSGDGIEQNDYITAGAVAGFDAPLELRVDNSVIRTGEGKTVRLPYWKFPRNPEAR